MPSSTSSSLTLPIGEPIEATFRPYSSSRWRIAVISDSRQLHHVLGAAAGVDEADAVVLQAEGGKGRELLHGRFVMGRLVGKTAEDDLAGMVGHVGRISLTGRVCDRGKRLL